MDDPYDLARFVRAQNAGGTFDQAVDELRGGRKRSHWMWFVFPQIAGLGRSAMAQRYAIGSVAEAKAYLAHPVLGPRLILVSRTVATLTGKTAEQIFGGIDAVKLRSSMTLFAAAAPHEHTFGDVLDSYFGGKPDTATRELINSAAEGSLS